MENKSKLRVFMADIQKINNGLLKPLGGKDKMEFFIGTRKGESRYKHIASLKINDIDMWIDRYDFPAEPTEAELEHAENYMYLNLLNYLLLYRFPIWEELNLLIKKVF